MHGPATLGQLMRIRRRQAGTGLGLLRFLTCGSVDKQKI